MVSSTRSSHDSFVMLSGSPSFEEPADPLRPRQETRSTTMNSSETGGAKFEAGVDFREVDWPSGCREHS